MEIQIIKQSSEIKKKNRPSKKARNLKKNPSILLKFPKDILMLILTHFLSLNDIFRLRRTCKKINEFIQINIIGNKKKVFFGKIDVRVRDKMLPDRPNIKNKKHVFPLDHLINWFIRRNMPIFVSFLIKEGCLLTKYQACEKQKQKKIENSLSKKQIQKKDQPIKVQIFECFPLNVTSEKENMEAIIIKALDEQNLYDIAKEEIIKLR